VPKAQGAYIWWLVDSPTTCLKVGRARLGARKEGLRRRIRQHLSSNADNTVFARHLEADYGSSWCAGYDFRDRAQRRTFLETKCTFQVLALPELTEDELDGFEDFLEARLKPHYINHVGT
jgi:hypothetical protein